MSNKLICPFCQQELRQDYTGVMYCCNEDCEQSADWYGSQILWTALTQAKQDLEIARQALKTTYTRGFTKSEAVGILQRNNMTISKALEQIGHKE